MEVLAPNGQRPIDTHEQSASSLAVQYSCLPAQSTLKYTGTGTEWCVRGSGKTRLQPGVCLSERRPDALAASDDMQMHMVHRLAAHGAIIDDYSEAILLWVFVCEALCSTQKDQLPATLSMI